MSVGMAVVGAGLLGERHAHVWSQLDRSELRLVVDVDNVRARRAANKYGAAWATTLEPILADTDVQAVSIATPDHLHVETAVTALEAGKHVFVEKPLATTAEGARAIVEAAYAAGRIVQVNFSQRWLQEYAHIKSVISSGEIGVPQFVISRKRDAITVPTGMIAWAAFTSPVFFMTSHDLDLVRWFLDSEPVSVVAEETTGTLDARDVSTHDAVNALVRFAGGAHAVFSTAWIHPETYPFVATDHLEVVGSHGVIEYDSRHRSLSIHSAKTARSIVFDGPATSTEVEGTLRGAFVESCEHFLCCLEEDTPSRTPASDSLVAVTCQEAMLTSAREGGRRVTIDSSSPTQRTGSSEPDGSLYPRI